MFVNPPRPPLAEGISVSVLLSCVVLILELYCTSLVFGSVTADENEYRDELLRAEEAAEVMRSGVEESGVESEGFDVSFTGSYDGVADSDDIIGYAGCTGCVADCVKRIEEVEGRVSEGDVLSCALSAIESSVVRVPKGVLLVLLSEFFCIRAVLL